MAVAKSEFLSQHFSASISRTLRLFSAYSAVKSFCTSQSLLRTLIMMRCRSRDRRSKTERPPVLDLFSVPTLCLTGLDSEVVRRVRLQITHFRAMRVSVRAPRSLRKLNEIIRVGAIENLRTAIHVGGPSDHRRIRAHAFQNRALRDTKGLSILSRDTDHQRGRDTGQQKNA